MDVRKSTGEHYVRFAVAGEHDLSWLEANTDVQFVTRRQDHLALSVADPAVAQALLQEAVRRELPVTRFDIDYPSLNEVFLTRVKTMGSEMQPTEEELATVPAG